MDQIESVFKNKNYVLTFLGALVSHIAALLLSFATSFYILKITNNNASIQGIYLAVCGVVFLLFSLFTGVLSDRFNKAVIMFLCDYVKGGLIIAGGIIVLLLNENDTIQLVLLFILGILFNIIAAVFSPASQSILPFILKEEQLQQGNSYMSVMNSFQAIIGVVLAGILYSVLPFYLLMIVVGVCYIASGVSEMFIHYQQEANQNKLTVKAVFTEIKDSFVYLKSMKAMSIFIIIILFVNFFFSPIDNNFIPYFITTDVAENPYFLFHEILNPEMWSSIITVCFCVGGIVGALILSKMKQFDKVSGFLKIQFSIMATCILGLALSYFFLVYKNISLNGYLITSAILCLIIGTVISFINIPITTTIAKICDKSMLGKVQSLINIGSQGLIPLSSFLAGLIIQYAGNATLLFVCTGGFIAITLVFLLSKKVNEL